MISRLTRRVREDIALKTILPAFLISIFFTVFVFMISTKYINKFYEEKIIKVEVENIQNLLYSYIN